MINAQCRAREVLLANIPQVCEQHLKVHKRVAHTTNKIQTTKHIGLNIDYFTKEGDNEEGIAESPERNH